MVRNMYTELQIRIMEMIHPRIGYRMRYYADRKYCPQCGFDQYISTVAALKEMSDGYSFRDENQCTCAVCGLTHIVHDRVKHNPSGHLSGKAIRVDMK